MAKLRDLIIPCKLKGEKRSSPFLEYTEYINLLMNAIKIESTDRMIIPFAQERLIKIYLIENGCCCYDKMTKKWSGAFGIGKNEEFKAFVMDVAKQVVKNNPATVEDLLAEPSIAEEGKTVQEVLVGKIATIGENITIRRFARFETTDGLIEKYIHGDGKIAVLVNMKNGNKELAKDICMQIAAARPEYVSREQVPAERLEKEKEILKAQTMNEGKPEAIAEKIVMGRINKFYEEICLVDQEFVKDSSMKVSQVLKDASVVEFARFEKGEGIEKKEENFAEEVMKQLQ